MSNLDLSFIKGKCADGVIRDFEATEETIAKCGMIAMMKVMTEVGQVKTFKDVPQEMIEFSEKLFQSASDILEYMLQDYQSRIVNKEERK